MYTLAESIVINAPPAKVFLLLSDVEKRMKLSPNFDVLSVKRVASELGRFAGRIRKEGREEEFCEEWLEVVQDQKIVASVVAGEKSRLVLTLETIPEGAKLIYEQVFEFAERLDTGALRERSLELRLWLRSIKAYLEIKNTLRGRAVKWFMDRVWLDLTPPQRRNAIFIFALEAGVLLMLVLFGIAYKLVKILGLA